MSSDRMGRQARCMMGRETVHAIESQKYLSLDGRPISLAEDLERLRQDTIVISAEEDVPLPPLSPNPFLVRFIDVESNLDRDAVHVEFMHCTALEACHRHRESKIGLLNFASAKNPGGGFMNGSQAQEESIARSSTLYASLTTPTANEQYYNRHKEIKPNDGIYTSTVIISPDVLVFRDENTGETLASPLRITIISSPAVNAGHTRKSLGTSEKIEQLIHAAMESRIERILAGFQRVQVETVILGAFGCGVFKNKVDDVAKLFKTALQKRQWRFQQVVFAITDAQMLKIFRDEFGVD